MQFRKWLALGAGLLAVAALAGAQAGNTRPDGYHVAKTIPLNNTRGWDYLGIDTPARNLYVSASDKEIVVNVGTGKVVGNITGLAGTHGVAIAGRDGHGFTSNGGDNTSTEFDLKTFKTIQTIKLPIERPDGIIYAPAVDRIFYFNHDSHAAAVDAKTGAVVGSILLPSKSAEFAVADGRGHVFNNLEDSSQEIEIDARTLKVTHVWPLAPCDSPSGLAMDRATRRLFVGCHNNMMAVVNADTGKVVATLPIGGGVDATRFDPGTQLAFSSNGGPGTITVIHEDSPDHFTVLGNVPTERSARTMEVDTQTHTLYTVGAKFEPPPKNATGRARFRGRMAPGSFHLLVITR